MARDAFVLISDIIIPAARMRHAPAVDDLAASIRQHGLLHPITLRQDGDALILVAGYRRLHAVQKLLEGEIRAHIVEATDVEALMMEIDENLQRAELTVLERAQHVAERKRLWEILYPQTRRGAAPGAGQGRGKQRADLSKDPRVGSLEDDPPPTAPRSFLDETADRTQRSRAALNYDVQIATKIPREAQDLLVGTAAADTQSELLALAKLPPDVQVQVAQQLHEGTAASVHTATTAAGWAPAPAIFTEVLDPVPPETAPSTLQQTATGDYEWGTPVEVLALVRAVLGQIDVDPASNAVAQARVQAQTFYTLDDSGLNHPWPGRVFLNPPYQTPGPARFIGKLGEELDAQRTTEAILLVNSATETDWYQRAFVRATAVCYPDGRMRFLHASKGNDSLVQGQAILYFGPQDERFGRVFVALGVTTPVRCWTATTAQLDLAAAPAPPPPAASVEMEPLPAGMKRCRKGHEPYPVSKPECPACVRERQQAKRQREAAARHAPEPDAAPDADAITASQDAMLARLNARLQQIPVYKRVQAKPEPATG